MQMYREWQESRRLRSHASHHRALRMFGDAILQSDPALVLVLLGCRRCTACIRHGPPERNPNAGAGGGFGQSRFTHAFLRLPLNLSPRNTLILLPYSEYKSFAFPRVTDNRRGTPFIPADFNCYALTLTHRHTFADSSWRLFTVFSVMHYGDTGLAGSPGRTITAGPGILHTAPPLCSP